MNLRESFKNTVDFIRESHRQGAERGELMRRCDTKNQRWLTGRAYDYAQGLPGRIDKEELWTILSTPGKRSVSMLELVRGADGFFLNFGLHCARDDIAKAMGQPTTVERIIAARNKRRAGQIALENGG